MLRVIKESKTIKESTSNSIYLYSFHDDSGYLFYSFEDLNNQYGDNHEVIQVKKGELYLIGMDDESIGLWSEGFTVEDVFNNAVKNGLLDEISFDEFIDAAGLLKKIGFNIYDAEKLFKLHARIKKELRGYV